MSLWTPEIITKRLLNNATQLSPSFAESYVRYIEWGKKKRAPEMDPTPGHEVRIRQECFRILMYSSIAHAALAMKGASHPIDVPALRKALLDALMSAPLEVAGPIEETKKRIARYHAAWTAVPNRLQAELYKVLAEATGVAGTPFEKVMDEVSSHGAKDWVDDGRRFIADMVK
jgi:hypothetical protein